MSKFWDSVKSGLKTGLNIADGVADVVSPTWQAASEFLETHDGETAKGGLLKDILAGEEKLLELHDFDNLSERQNEILDDIAILATEFAILQIQAKMEKSE